MSPAEIERAFEAFVDRVEGAIRRMPASEVAAERERIHAEAIARLVSVKAKAPNVARRRPDWSRLGLNVGGLVAVLVFMGVWALTALMGGLLGFLLGWLPASIIARFCFYAWPIVLAVVVIAVFGIAAAVNQNTAPQPAADPYAGIATEVRAAPAAEGAADAQPAVQPVTPTEPPAAVAAHDASWPDHDERVAAAVRGEPLVNATSSELNALVEECPSHRITGAPAAGFVCDPASTPSATTTPAPQAAPAAADPPAVAPNTSAPAPAASQPQQIAQR